MKPLSLSLIIFCTLITEVQVKYYKSQFDEYNKTFNCYVYLYKTLWDYLKTNALIKAEIYTKNEKMTVSYFNTGVYHDYMFRKLFYYTADSTDEEVNKIVLYNKNGNIKTIKASEGNIPYHTFEPLDKFAYDHLNYLNNHEVMHHQRFNTPFGGRIKAAGIDYEGSFAENIALHEYSYRSYTKLERIMHAFRGYFNNREQSDHWKELMQEEKNYRYYTTYFLEDDSKGRLYSITIMTTGQLYEIEK